MLNHLANLFVRIMGRWMPDPFVFCGLMTLLCYGLALMLTPVPPRELVSLWYDGLWKILSFTMQVILLLLTGYTLAMAPPVRRMVERLASIPRSQGGAVVMVTVLATLGYLIHWGFTTVAAAILARAIVRKVPRCDFRFLIAAVYSASVIGGSGFGSTIPLVSATAESEMNFIARYTGHAVGVSQTVLSPMNLALVGGILIGLPIMFRMMMPRGDQIRTVDPALLAEPYPDVSADSANTTPAQRLERSRFVLYILVALGSFFLLDQFLTRRLALDYNRMILLALTLGMALHGQPAAYVRAFNKATHVVGPIALQFPFYGGIMGITEGSGLAAVISNWFVSFSDEVTLPFFCFLAAMLINFAIPSASGHWIVQGPIFVPAGVQLGVKPASIAMAVAFGDEIANMVQPFWALPILAIANLSVRDIMGYCIMTFLLATVLATLALFLLA